MKTTCPSLTLVLLAVVLLLPPPVFSKEKEEIPAPPPMAKTGVSTVFIDSPAEIPLQIAGRIVEPLVFLIRKQPRHGKLGEVRRTGRNSASVLYTPEPHAGPGDDVFSFAAKSVDSPVSAPATVWIRLVERPTDLVLPDAIDFGTVFLGDKAERELEVTNAGGGVAVGSLRVNAPWHAAAPGNYRVPGGKSASIPIRFEPTEERDFSDRIILGADPKSAVLVRGTGIAPVTWPKEGLIVSPADREKDSASLTLANNTAAERTVTIDWPEFVKGPAEVILPANGSSAVSLQIAAPSSLNFEGEVGIRSGNFTGKIPARIFPTPARLRIDPEGVLKLGTIKDDRGLHGRFVVKNTGGSTAPLQIIAPPGILILPDPASIILPGGGEQAFQVHADRADSAELTKFIEVRSPACEAVKVSIEYPSRSESRAAVPVENFLSIPPVASDALPTTQPALANIPRIETANLVTSGSHEVEIEWNFPSQNAVSFRIERRRISSGSAGQVLVDWVPWPEARITQSPGTGRARFEHLPANSFWTIRIIPVDEKGMPGPPSPAFQIATRPSQNFTIPAWVWVLAVLALAAAFIKLHRQRQRGLHAREDERIARLEEKK